MNILANDGISSSDKTLLESKGFSVNIVNVAQEQLINFINDKNIEVLLVRSATEVRKKLKEQGKTVIVVSHDMPLVAEDTDRVLVMCDTELIFDGTPSRLFASKEILSKTNLLPPQITSFTQKVGLNIEGESVLSVEEAEKAL